MNKLLFLFFKIVIGVILSILSGLLLSFSWPEIGFSPLIFVAFIPLLLLEKYISQFEEKTTWIVFIKTILVFGYSFITFFIFNITTTYWVWHATISGAFAAFVINALLMSFSFVLFHKVKRVLGNKRGYFALIFFWISIEYLHLHWELAWPWLTLGNVFATIPEIVQWYEFTGVLGGSIWVLLINISLFIWWDSERIRKKLILPFTILLIPIIISLSLKTDFDERKRIEVVIVQPNVNPYHDKFNRSPQVQLDDFITLAKEKLTQDTKLLIGPETALQESIFENKIEHTQSYQKLRRLQEDFSNLNIIIGASTFKYIGEKKDENSRKLRDEKGWYNAYNSAIFLGSDSTISIYHKSKLVPGVEQIPYSFILDVIADFTVDLGGISGSLSSDNTINNFQFNDLSVLPLICYESVFGDVISGKRSNIIAIITNDGWWENTAGYKQHFQYARLRAIEQRKSIIRSANTGISGLIYSNGEIKIQEQTNWNEKIAINVKVPLNEKVTFYNRYGDYIGRLSSFVAVLLILISFVKKRLKKIPTS